MELTRGGDTMHLPVTSLVDGCLTSGLAIMSAKWFFGILHCDINSKAPGKGAGGLER